MDGVKYLEVEKFKKWLYANTFTRFYWHLEPDYYDGAHYLDDYDIEFNMKTDTGESASIQIFLNGKDNPFIQYWNPSIAKVIWYETDISICDILREYVTNNNLGEKNSYPYLFWRAD